MPEVYNTTTDEMLIGAEAEAYIAENQRLRDSDPYLALRQDLVCLCNQYGQDIVMRALNKTLTEYAAPWHEE